MSVTTLLNSINAPLQRLALSRIQLDTTCPAVTFSTDGQEGLLYSLIGLSHVAINGHYVGMLGGRSSVTEHRIHAVRCPAGTPCTLTVSLHGYATDLLWLTCAQPRNVVMPVPRTPYLHWNDATWHDVGTGCYRRTVAEVPTPHGYEIHCGETYSDGVNGCWSSWPSHAAPEEVSRYAEHEEIFFCLTPGYFLMRMNGRYCDGTEARGVREIGNGEAIVTPLGAHEIVTSPGSPSIYWWGYISFLKKQYNKYADESIKRVYVK